MKSKHSGLQIVAQKAPIVATHMGPFEPGNTQTLLERYLAEASTYVEPPEIQDYKQRLIQEILGSQVSIGCLVAPFGYGKTSAAIDIWNACSNAGILAIPPFSCSSIAEMGQAIFSGVICGLANASPDARRKIEVAYDEYLVSSAQRMALHDTTEYSIEYETALKSIQDKIERGYLHLEASGTNLLTFIEQVVEIVRECNFQGLVIFVDEFQQFLGTINKAVITNFRTLIWGLKTSGDLPLGLVITMDPDTERNLSERAGDILHRIKDNGLYINFTDIYDREFPRLLWDRYASAYDFNPISDRVVDRAVLEALGQMCERGDLSNGPRTVIDAFQQIATFYERRKRPYSVFDLIDDLSVGSIKFDGDQGKIASLVTELIGYDYIKKVPARVNTLKLIAAFPRGCPREIAEFYELAETFDELSDELRGEILTLLPEGIALIDLQRVGKPQNKLNIILKKYWLQITEQEIIADRILPLFGQYAMDALFPDFGNILTGWRRLEDDFMLTPLGGYLQRYEGTFFEEYPLRHVCIQLCRDQKQIVDSRELDPFIDLNLIFMLEQSDLEKVQPELLPAEAAYIFTIPVNRPFDKPLPRDIRWIEDYLSPVVLTPSVLLSLLSYIEKQLPKIEGITEAEQLRIADTKRKLQEFLGVMLFNEGLFTGLQPAVISRGAQALRDALFAMLRVTYPDYKTLITSPQWEATLEDYAGVLASLPLLERRGVKPICESKSAIALRFGYRNHAGFESQTKQIKDLLSIQRWTGDQGEIVFLQHPGETYLRKELLTTGSLTMADALQTGHRIGYTTAETRFLLRLLELRAYIGVDSEIDAISTLSTLSVTELDHLCAKLLGEAELIQSIDSNVELLDLHDALKNILVELNGKTKTDLEEVQSKLLGIQQSLNVQRINIQDHMHQRLTRLHQDLHDLIEAFGQELPTSTTGLEIDTHINGIQRTLSQSCHSVLTRLSKLGEVTGETLRQPVNIADLDRDALSDVLNLYSSSITEVGHEIGSVHELVELTQLHTNWVLLISKVKRLQDYLSVAEAITDVEAIRHRLDSILDQVARKLARIGMSEYGALYNSYAPAIDGISTDLFTAVKLLELTSNKLDNDNTPAPPNTLLQEMSNQKLIELLSLQPQASISYLAAQTDGDFLAMMHEVIRLEEKGQVITIIRLLSNMDTSSQITEES